ncbi:MAG TPA: 6-bladed beta-propeller, partial [Gemmatimonadaceae bacterium]|nr:6-bladed beta-propeller [Gemmatimonadaceae bacterium]
MKAPSTWSLASRPELEIGGSSGDGPTSFGDVAGVGVLGSDLVVVGDSKANELRVFDRGGAFVRAFGRGGSGPGEFSRVLWSVHALGDRILATDNGGRAQLFASSGQLLSSWGRPTLQRLVEPKRIGLFRGSGHAVQALDVSR